MSLSQLSATRHRLSETLKFFEAKVDERTKATLAGTSFRDARCYGISHFHFPENQKVMIDLRDWGDSDSDSDDETTTGMHVSEYFPLLHLTRIAAGEPMEFQNDAEEPLRAP